MLGMDTIFDLPAHPLMVHFPVVAIPVLAILGLVMAARPRFRDNYSLPVLALAVVTVVATFMAARSGQALVDTLGLSDEQIHIVIWATCFASSSWDWPLRSAR